MYSLSAAYSQNHSEQPETFNSNQLIYEGKK